MTGEFPAQSASNAEMFPFDDVIMKLLNRILCDYNIRVSIHIVYKSFSETLYQHLTCISTHLFQWRYKVLMKHFWTASVDKDVHLTRVYYVRVYRLWQLLKCYDNIRDPSCSTWNRFEFNFNRNFFIVFYFLCTLEYCWVGIERNRQRTIGHLFCMYTKAMQYLMWK